MDFDSTSSRTLNFYLSSLEEQVMSEMGDSTARITQTTDGRVNIDIREDLLEEFLNDLQELRDNNKNNWSQERKDMQREMHSLKAQLKDAQEKYKLLLEETNDHRSKMGKICTMLRETQRDLKQQTCEKKEKLDQMKEENKALQDKMETLNKVREENKTLRNELEAIKLELRVEKQLRATAEHNTVVTAHSLNILLFEKDTAEFEARSKAEQLEADLAFERTRTQKEKEKLSKVEQAFKKQKEEAKKSAAQSQATYRTKQEELRQISLSLKKAESLLETKQVSLEQKNSSLETMSKAKDFYVSQLDAQKERNNNLVAAQERIEKQFESERMEWQKERSSLIQTTETLKETLQCKEQEWEENKEIMDTHIKGLHTYATEKLKKKRRRWWNLF
ncbi:myosin-6 [Larimichthys crocea]|uniref:myosin-6 n=1 Tax=Larimichthys crocea TaxID=215358 RepID=UPI000F5EB47C|nr:myosin-6 [Larimichthys crocea]